MNGYERAYALMEEIYNNFSSVDKLWFINEESVAMHSSLGRHLRNHAKLWEDKWEPVIWVDGVDYSENHPDAISSRVIKNFQEKLKSEIPS